jgi:hypothetical protein
MARESQLTKTLRKENSELNQRLWNAKKETSRVAVMEQANYSEGTKWMILTAKALGSAIEVTWQNGKLVFEAVRRDRA